MAADMVRMTRLQSQRWRDMLWESVLEEFEERDPVAGQRARDAAKASPAHLLYGDSTVAATRAWPYLDVQARLDWIWVCQFVNRTWVHQLQAVLKAPA